jgi:hypothetical protein
MRRGRVLRACGPLRPHARRSFGFGLQANPRTGLGAEDSDPLVPPGEE